MDSNLIYPFMCHIFSYHRELACVEDLLSVRIFNKSYDFSLITPMKTFFFKYTKKLILRKFKYFAHLNKLKIETEKLLVPMFVYFL